MQLLLPLFDNDGHAFSDAIMRGIREDLVARFGGITAFSRSPAEGVWSHGGEKVRDDIVLVEVMVETLDQGWWQGFGRTLERTLQQQSIVIRAFDIVLL
ncbi:MAG TPA: hypothetical protein VG798_01000 [Rhizomicrobium sp.]|nr:hypothetical protein [Rhizomicrobium sp.]